LPLKQRIRSGITFPFSSAVIANSHAGINVYKPQSSKAHVIYNGFDFDRIKNLTPAEILKKKYGIPENQFVVGMVARFEKHKDYETFLSAASRILKQGKDAIFLLVGDGRQLPVYESVYSKGFDDRIRFLGRQQNVEEIINIFDIGVLATFTEGISNSVMEYMALKKPVVVTDCPGNREIVVHGKTGFVVPVKNPDRLAEKISELLIDGRLREQCGEAGYKRIVENFTIGIMAEGFLNIYRNIINGKEQIH